MDDEVLAGRELISQCDAIRQMSLEQTLDENIEVYMSIHDEWRLSCSLRPGCAGGW
jgi:hypothetical protein